MSNRVIKYYAILLIVFITIGAVILYNLLPDSVKSDFVKNDPKVWYAPDINSLQNSAYGKQILYGRDLVMNTSKYLGPKGIVARISNGMNCGNCHLDGGTRINGNDFAAVAANYPKFRNRSGIVESIEFRINDCFKRSLNGNELDSSGKEMKAMVAYIKWLGKDVPKHVTPNGSGVPEIDILDRATDPEKGKFVFVHKCSSCHGGNGQGELNLDSTVYTYPPLWGNNSYNTAAGLYRISSLAGFVKYNMPYTTVQVSPQLNDEESWDVAAYVNSQERPVKVFKQDWPDIKNKPYDFPFGPYIDSFSEKQHKFGPFAAIKNKKPAF